MGKKTVDFTKSGIGKLPDDKPVVYRIKTDGTPASLSAAACRNA